MSNYFAFSNALYDFLSKNAVEGVLFSASAREDTGSYEFCLEYIHAAMRVLRDNYSTVTPPILFSIVLTHERQHVFTLSKVR